KENSLPPLRDADGQLIDRDTVRYLLHRQARAGKVELDLEARALCDLIDRRSSGDFALLLLKGYLTAGANLQDRWALVLACLLGDDRIVPPLHSQIRTWAESQQPNRAEDAVRALALARTDAALMTLDALAVRYRSKRPYLGEEAAEGFTRAAQQQGLTLDELGDRVVPWLGFEPGKPRLLVWAKRQLEVRIGLNFKFEFLDRQTGKALKALPAGVPEALQKDHREQSGMLKEAVKAQLTRLENLLVRGHRWPVGRWRELFLAHPLLIPFAVRLVWGIYDASGGLTGTFRALEDGSLTGADDSGMSLPAAGSVGIVHPLELDADARKAWQRHLADYEIEPPFPQLERPVLSVPPGQKRAKVATDHAGAVVMAGTFRNRAEKLGWGRTAVSGGRIVAYGKRFTGAGLDALVGLEDMYVGANWDDEIALGRVCFVRSAGEGRGTYADVPDESNPDLVPLGKVPPVVYSEVMGDLKRIVGQKAHVEEESF
ncbi:MAG TPA: DUF4132 domain-containing protein, partial [Roseiflexaceae bacterium]|nr:DUF4132 domain-containing protein [Gemmataceae bacterium]